MGATWAEIGLVVRRENGRWTVRLTCPGGWRDLLSQGRRSLVARQMDSLVENADYGGIAAD